MANEKALGSVKLGLGLDGTEFQDTLDKVTKSIKVAESSMRANSKAFENYGKTVESLQQKQKDLTDVSETYNNKLKVLQDRLAKQKNAEVKNQNAIDATKKAINDTIAKQNEYANKLNDTRKELIYAEEGVNDLSQALKDNTQQMNDEVKAFKSIGDSASAFESKQKGLTKQSELLKQSIDAQKNVVKRMAEEFGESSSQVQKAEKSLQSLKNQSNITEKQLDALKNSTNEVAENFEQSADSVSVFEGSLLADFASKGLETVKNTVASIIDNLNEASEQYNLLKAQLGNGVDVSALQANIQSVFKEGFGDSLEEVQTGMVAIKQMLPNLSGSELEQMTANVLAFSKATDSDMNESIRGAKALMESFGLSSEQAFDYMNKGAQNGLNQSGELADNLNEYSSIFKQNGFNAEQMFALLDNGLKNGAMNLDKVNDFAKEFGVSLNDGRIEENISKFSKGTKKLFKEFKDGKASSNDVLKAITNDMKNMKSETDKAALASTLWSSLGEDNSLKMIESLGNTNDAYKKIEGTTQDVNKAISNSEPFEALKRNVSGSFSPFSEKISGLKSQVTDLINNTFDKFPTASSLGIGALTTAVGVLAGAFLIALIPSGVFASIMTAIGTAIGVLTSPITLTIGAIGLLIGAFVLAYQKIEPFKKFIDDLMFKIKEFSEKIYNEYIKPSFEEVIRTFNELATAIKQWWDQNGAQFMQALTNFFSMVWAIIQPALQFWSGIFKSTFETIVSLVKIGWDTIKGVFSGAFTIIKGLLDIFIGVFTGDWSKVWNGVKGVVEGVWKIITSGFKGFVDGITSLAGGIGTAIASGIGGAVNGVIDAINWVLEKLGAAKIGHVTWGQVQTKKYAQGTDGHSGGNAIVNDGKGAELVVNPSGSAYIPQGKNVFIPQMAKGTRVFTAEQTARMFGKNSPTFHYKNGIGNSIMNFAGDILDFIKDPVSLLKKTFSNFANFGNLFEPWLGIARSGTNYIMDNSFNFLKKLFDKKKESETVKYNTSAGVEQWRGLATKALQMTNQFSESNLSRLLMQMQSESSGNPNIVNNWDINAKNGIPSKGLMQVIQPTFSAYAMSDYDKNVLDPLSNILASIRYTVSRYGSLVNGWKGRGYENGGLIIKQHLAMVGEGNKPEMIIPLQKAKRSRAMQLLAKTKNILGDNDNIFVSQKSQTDTSALESKFDVMINLMTQLLNKDSNVYMDAKKINKTLSEIESQSLKQQNRNLGLLF
ncbi:phage tail tape measure protein [Enterococcus sp. AZ102]|uniref:phage tail tape measure protein n=1 Tax=Enterococcus sp. AZ102 TaxID=2774865 RepID=UPI003F27C94E